MLEQNHYKSPIRKLVNFFEKSRDNWKEKYQLNKKENKKLKTKICTLKASQQKWKRETLLLRKQLKQAAINTENIITETAKKKQDSVIPDTPLNAVKIAHHSYSATTIFLMPA